MEKKFQRFQYGESSWNVLHVTKFGQDPSLDFFMRSYIDLLTKFREDLENPYNKFAQYKDKVTKDLEDLCGHYIETTPDEEDNFGSDIGTKDMSQDLNDLEILGEENLMYTADIDESIVIDPDAADEELKKMLRLKYGKHIAGLKAEFNRVRKKGKLPTNARQILKDWFSRHSYWPYPSEMEKAYLQRLCGLNLKQINNWFINERKRHWSCEGKCMYPNTKFYPRDGHVDPNNHGEGYLEQ
ncbi:homeobox protein knotted-1-like 2 [Physcomitrium patens]